MSYILDALRKSEQQRQATQPENVTDRILITPPQPKQKSAMWIAALVVGNLLAIAAIGWFFTQKNPAQVQLKEKTVVGTQEKQLMPLTTEKRTLPPAPITQDTVTQKAAQPLPKQIEPQAPSPSIAELIETKKMAEVERPVKQIPDKKTLTAKKELTIRSKTIPANQPKPAYSIQEKSATLPVKKGAPDLNELPYEVRNNLPNLNINVFSYANQPEDRFVIIDMVKYKTGQLVKGSVKLKEIRPDSIVLQYGDDTFRVERP
jgi:general secretion pathway protein B